MALVHQTEFDISFKHCDPAGIVFYPRYAEMINDIVEHWFKNGLTCDFATLHGPREIAIPAVKLDVEFKQPAHLGETLRAELRVIRIGNSSMRMGVSLLGKGSSSDKGLKLVAQLTVVFVTMRDKQPVDIPPDLRRRAELFLDEPAPGA